VNKAVARLHGDRENTQRIFVSLGSNGKRLYILEGKVRHEFGPGLKQVLEYAVRGARRWIDRKAAWEAASDWAITSQNDAGDFIYIKPGVSHEVFNMSDTQPVVAFVARSSADEWDEIIPYDRKIIFDRAYRLVCIVG
jgi:hypothetical protein